MTDFNTKYKLYPHGYVHTLPEKSCLTYRDLYREHSRLNFKSFSSDTIRAHDCREPIVKDHQDTHKWDAFILSHGLKATCENVDKLHQRRIPKSLDDKRPDKLLFHLGNERRSEGSADGEFSWPRGLAVSTSGEIYVADTANHRIQSINAFGVLTKMFGKLGTGDGEFNQPTAVAVTMNDEIMVADSKNRRIQSFTRRKIFKDSFFTNDEPYSLVVDIYYNVVVGTYKRTVEIYRRGGRLVNRFRVCPKNTQEGGPLYVAVSEMHNHIVVSDPADRAVKTYNYSGELLHKFEPTSALDGLACVPAGLHVLLSGNICLCDSLNHMVNEYTDKGTVVKQLIGPMDSAGSVQQCYTSPEGHLVVTEYSTNNLHCLKIFRYKECECHKYRPGSSKRPPTPHAYQMKTVSL